MMDGISVIICSRTSELDADFRNNIETTIGFNHEIIVIDNSKNEYNIFQAYNKGVDSANMSIICFMHDDVRFHTQNWGESVCRHFESSEVGMIGVAGPTYLSAIPGIWWGIDNEKCRNNSIRQVNIDTDRFNKSIHEYRCINPFSEKRSEVVVLDGLFFCVRKSLFKKIRFDESFGGFHFYDLDISLQVRRENYKLFCVYDVLVEHISTSSINSSWVCANRKFFNKWRNVLPQRTSIIEKKQIREMEYCNIDTLWKILGGLHLKPIRHFTIREILWALVNLPDFFYKKLFNFFR